MRVSLTAAGMYCPRLLAPAAVYPLAAVLYEVTPGIPGSRSTNLSIPPVKGPPIDAVAVAPVPVVSVMVTMGAVKLRFVVNAGIVMGSTTPPVAVAKKLTSGFVPYASEMVTVGVAPYPVPPLVTVTAVTGPLGSGL